MTTKYARAALGSKDHGIDIQKVQEIRGVSAVTHITDAIVFIKGAVNLRGLIVAMVDMPIRLGIRAPRYDALR